jgi:hypothetical protein
MKLKSQDKIKFKIFTVVFIKNLNKLFYYYSYILFSFKYEYQEVQIVCHRL